jgi:DNA-binding NarL/FixJ family response regulator
MLMAKIIIVDDHQMFRESLRKLLTIENIADVIAEASNGKELLELLDNFLPDIILMDIYMPVMDGIEATKKVLKKHHDLKVIALSSFGDEKYYFSMIEAGAKGFVLKTAGIVELQSAINEVAAGGSWLSANLMQKIITNFNSKPKKSHVSILSDRELEVLKLICESYTNEKIAEKLNISIDTVKWHRANMLTKTTCINTAGLVIYAIKNKLIEI